MLAIFNMLIEKYKNTRVESEFLTNGFSYIHHLCLPCTVVVIVMFWFIGCVSSFGSLFSYSW